MNSCRICLDSKAKRDLTKLNVTIDEKTHTFVDIMLFCLGIKIDTCSNINTKLCLKCYRKIEEFYKFKSLALKNDAYLRSLSIELKNEVPISEQIIKKEEEVLNSDQEYDEESIIHLNDNNADTEVLFGVKYEFKNENQSDDELLSVIKQAKYQAGEDSKENAPMKKKRGRPPTFKDLQSKKLKSEYQICDECGKEVKNLKAHSKCHLPSSKVKCELCDKIFSSIYLQRRHVNRRHYGIKQKCPHCDKEVRNIQQHIKLMHKKESLPYQCDICKRRFLSKGSRDCHITIHSSDRPYECEQCGAKFRLSLSLNNHIRQVHIKEKNNMCQFCSKSFFKAYHLQVHLRTHTKQKPYTCPECGKKFQTTSTLKNHRLLHGDVRNYKCTWCDMTFHCQSYLRAHLLSHTKEKRYPCQYCDVKFHRSDHRKRHEFTAHLRHTPAAATT